MLKKLGLWTSGLFALAYSSFGAVTEDAAAIKTKIDGLVGNAEGIFDAVVPVVLAVVALGVLIAFAKRIKKS